MQSVLAHETAADQEVPREAVLQEPAPGEFDFNEFFNLDKSVPGLASVSEVLGQVCTCGRSTIFSYYCLFLN